MNPGSNQSPSLSFSRREWLFAALAVLYFLAQLATLTRTPLPWGDEVFFASMTDSFSRQGTMHVLVEPVTYPEPLLLYGPVYFALSVPFERIFGLTPLMSRLPGLLFGLSVIAVAFALLRARGVSRGTSLAVCAMLALDPAYSGSLHRGRMDTTSLFFLLASFLPLLKSREVALKPGLAWAALSGLLAVAGVLTTPRPGYLVVVMGLILVSRIFRDERGPALARLLTWSGVILAVYFVWVFAAFGSLGNLLAYYGRFAGDYVGGTTFMVQQLPLLLLVFVPLAALLLLRPRAFGDELLIFSILGSAGYFVFVRDLPRFGGTYSILMLPMTYMTLGLGVSTFGDLQATAVQRRLRAGVFGLLLLANGAVFLGRTLLVLVQWQERSPEVAEKLVAGQVPPGSRVIGDPAFYFVVRRAGSEFQFFEADYNPRITTARRAAYHRDVFRADYLITGAAPESLAVQTYQRELGFVELAGPPPAPEEGPLAKLILRAAIRFGFGPIGSDPRFRGFRGAVYGRPASGRR